MKKEKKFDLELFFSALADKTRLRLLNLMRDGEVCVCLFAETLDTNNPKISRHLAYLRRAKLVSGRRDGKWMHYRISEPDDTKGKTIFAGIMEMLKEDKEMRFDREKFTAVCCTPQTLVKITKSSRNSIKIKNTNQKALSQLQENSADKL